MKIQIADKKNSAVEMIKASIARVKECEDYNVFISLDEEGALLRAAAIDVAIAKGEKIGRLAGVPYALKDLMLTKDEITTAGSKMLSEFRAPITATCVKKLEAEGAICIGRTNLDSFAHGSSTENSYFGVTLNSRDKTRVSGGSSGGSAVAVALEIVPFSVGSDTGGSIRQPASFNGVVGVKPTYGAVSRYGVASMISSTDTIGVFANDSSDASLVMEVMAGKDEKDSTSIDGVYEVCEGDLDVAKLRVGVVKEMMGDGVDKEIRDAVSGYVEELRALGAEVEEVSMPSLKYALAIYYIIMPAEITSNSMRYDGVRYGFRAEGDSSLDETYGKTRDQGFMAENKRRIMLGNFVLSSGSYDAYYLKAEKARTVLMDEFAKLFEKFDVLVGPVAPSTAFELGKNTADPLKMYLEDIMTVPASLAGLPAISVPFGKDSEGLDIGVQLIGRRGSDKSLLAIAREIEKGVKK